MYVCICSCVGECVYVWDVWDLWDLSDLWDMWEWLSECVNFWMFKFLSEWVIKWVFELVSDWVSLWIYWVCGYDRMWVNEFLYVYECIC